MVQIVKVCEECWSLEYFKWVVTVKLKSWGDNEEENIGFLSREMVRKREKIDEIIQQFLSYFLT